MNKLTIGTVVIIDGQTYMFDSGNELGKNVFIPIKHDDSKPSLNVTPEIRSKAKFYYDGKPIKD